MKGIPTAHPLFSTYWRKRTAPPQEMDPDRDGCGLLWCSPIAPNDGAHARRVTQLATQRCLADGFEPAISLTVLTDRTLSCILCLTYDRDVPGEDARASACYNGLIDLLAKEGYHPYRLAVNAMHAMDEGNAYSETLGLLKRTLDPNQILSPGRYLPV